jgi:hypothetical protein
MKIADVYNTEGTVARSGFSLIDPGEDCATPRSMKKKSGKFIFRGFSWVANCVCLIMFFSTSCMKTEQQQPSTTPSSKQGKITGSEIGPKGGQGVFITPESPTVTTDLSAVVSGIGGSVAYRWMINGSELARETGPVLLKGLYRKGDVITLTVTSDGKEATATTVIQNSPPRVVEVPFSPERVYAGIDVSVAPQAVDPDGDAVMFHYRWTVNGEDIPEDSSILKGNLFKHGDIVNLTIIPYDYEAAGEPFVSKALIIPNAPPQFVSTPPKEFANKTYVYQAKAEDPDGDSINYTLGSAPQGMTIDSRTGLITWIVGGDQSGTHEVEVVATDSEGMKAYQHYTLAITIVKQGEQ